MNLRISKKVPVVLAFVIVFLTVLVFVGPKLTQAKTVNNSSQQITVVSKEADTADVADVDAEDEEAVAEAADSTGSKAIAAAIAIGLASLGGAIGMGIA
ncbi:MAG: hypothetical protein IJT72_05195, partial [Lachnospiraceae bacterium]|nr:hypothetical protein [Lachnospiraceae bacterium]